MFKALRPSSFLSPYLYQYFRYIRSQDNHSVAKCKQQRIFVLLAADYGNLGDIAITYAQCQLLSCLFPTYYIEKIPTYNNYNGLKSLIKNIGENDIITIVGGGNCSDLYYPFETYRQLVVSLIKNHKIISFPQSLLFSKMENLYNAFEIYNERKNLLFLFRDTLSKDLAYKFSYNIKTNVLPDVVFTLNRYKTMIGRNGIITCLRKDVEKKITREEESCIMKVLESTGEEITVSDTYIGKGIIPLNETTKLLNSFIGTLSSHKLLVTDRLHGMIMGFITGTPTVVIANSNNKILGSYKWVEDSNFIIYLDSINSFESALTKLKNIVPDQSFIISRIKEYRQMYEETLKAFLS